MKLNETKYADIFNFPIWQRRRFQFYVVIAFSQTLLEWLKMQAWPDLDLSWIHHIAGNVYAKFIQAYGFQGEMSRILCFQGD